MNPNYASELRDVLLRQLQYLETLEGGRLLAAIPSYVDLIATEPTLRIIAEDLRHDAAERIQAFADHDAQVIAELREFWVMHSSWIVDLWSVKESAGRTPAMEARGNPWVGIPPGAEGG